MSKKIANLFILDKSSSMGSIRDFIITAFNEQIGNIKKLDEENNTQSSISLFSFNHEVQKIALNKPIKEQGEINRDNYIPHGNTALYDGIGLGCKALEDSLGGTIGEYQVVVTTLTDGEENSSHLYAPSQIADIMDYYRSEFNWTFTFIGANIDTEKLATSLKVDASNAINFVATAKGVEDASGLLNSARTSYYSKSLSGQDVSKDYFSELKQKKQT